MIQIQVGSTITNGSSAIRVTERAEKDARWGTPGWRGLPIPFDGYPVVRDFVSDHEVVNWRHVPFEWTEYAGSGVEERYVWTDGWRRLQREVRRAARAKPGPIQGHRTAFVIMDEWLR
jgi:hypothetical protein